MGYRDRTRSRSRDRRRRQSSRRHRDRSVGRRKRSRSLDSHLRKTDRRTRDDSRESRRRRRSRSRDDASTSKESERRPASSSSTSTKKHEERPPHSATTGNSSSPSTVPPPRTSRANQSSFARAQPPSNSDIRFISRSTDLSTPQPSAKYCQLYEVALAEYLESLPHNSNNLVDPSSFAPLIHPNDFRKYERLFSFWRKHIRGDHRSIFELPLLEAREGFVEFVAEFNRLQGDQRDRWVQDSLMDEQVSSFSGPVQRVVWSATHSSPQY
jgi:hypothetical protein